jgi:hypothetical protein
VLRSSDNYGKETKETYKKVWTEGGKWELKSGWRPVGCSLGIQPMGRDMSEPDV